MLKSDTPSSRKKVITLVSTLFIPVSMWFINILLMVSGIMEGSWISAIAAAIIASGLIFLIERNIIMSNGSRTILVFRVCIGFFIAFLGSITMDEVIFRNDIDMQMTKNMEKEMELAEDKVIRANEIVVASHEKLVSEKYNQWIQALEKATMEADGTGGSGSRGVHEIARLKMAFAAKHEFDYNKAKDNLEKMRLNINLEKRKASDDVVASFNNSALLERIRAMFFLVSSDNYMLIIYLALTFFLFFLEFIVVILKWKLPKSNYEYKLEVIEEIGKKRLDQLRNNDSWTISNARLGPAIKNTDMKVRNIAGRSLFN
jgi:hypothetical protein